MINGQVCNCYISNLKEIDRKLNPQWPLSDFAIYSKGRHLGFVQGLLVQTLINPTQGPSTPNLVSIGPVVSEEKIQVYVWKHAHTHTHTLHHTINLASYSKLIKKSHLFQVSPVLLEHLVLVSKNKHLYISTCNTLNIT